jgi:hypothetical protein
MLALLAILLGAGAVCSQTPSFTYQGRLNDGGNPANGNYDLRFSLFDSLNNGTQIGSTQTIPAVTVSGGVFTVQLDFGAGAFPGASRWLETGVRLSGAPAFTSLTPRQQITSTPYALRSLNASSADTVTVNGVPSGSGNYVQNSLAQQASANFNISGNGFAGGVLSANAINTTTGYNLAGIRILSNAGTQNLFAGIGAGQANTVGSNNAFFGFNAGAANTGDPNNGNMGIGNAFFGALAGEANKAGRNAFFGTGAGQANTTGASNAFFGYQAGILNNGGNNSYFGFQAGRFNYSGAQNSFFGEQAGFSNQTGNYNSYFGETAGYSNTTGSFNTMIGRLADVGANNLSNATAIGANARVDQNNSLVLGSIFGINGATSSVNVGIGTTTPQAALDLIGAAVFRPAGLGSPRATSLGSPNAETGMSIHGPTNRADVRFDGSTLKLVAALGVVPPAATNGIAITTAGNVGIGTTNPGMKLAVVGDATVSGSLTASGAGEFGGTLKVNVIESGFGEGMIHLCRNAALKIATCSSSSLRYKEQVVPFRTGLDVIRKLRPISFTWKADGTRDVGLGAEDVAQVAPLLVTHNDRGEIEGVKYDHLNVVLINAIKQQQVQIETLRSQNAALNARLRSVERMLRKKVGSKRR